MIRTLFCMMLIGGASLTLNAQDVTIRAVNSPAASVFRSIMQQTDKNFVYSADLLHDLKVTVIANKRPLKKVLNDMFANTDIEYKIKGKNVVLKRKPIKKQKQRHTPLPPKTHLPEIKLKSPQLAPPVMLEEVVVLSRLEAPAVETAEIGAEKVTADEVRNTPALLGEADVIKALQTRPGVAEATEGMAGMCVHGGNPDENLYMLDNVPLYQVNHFAGLFSAFNTDIIRYIDFFTTSMPAKYDGRLSSFMDVRTQTGNKQGHHGSAGLGITSASFNISGPIGGKTSYLIGMRRSWYDVLTVPALAIINANQAEKTRFHYYFMDLNAKVSHRFTPNTTGFVSIYFGDDMLKTGYKDSDFDNPALNGSAEDEKYNFHWGNLIAQTGLNYRIAPTLMAEFNAAYTRYFSDTKHRDIYKTSTGTGISISEDFAKTNNNINDWIFRGDFKWNPSDAMNVRFGVNYVRHSFLPARSTHHTRADGLSIETRDSTWAYGANEANIYIEDDWQLGKRWRINGGVHSSLFNIDGSVKYGVSPRLSASYRPIEALAVKGAYNRTVQYVHQLSQSYLSLPTDQWIPITGSFKPQTADKIALGVYWQSPGSAYTASAVAYYKWMHNLIDYHDEYYLRPPLEMWNARLTSGRGSAKGIDLMIEKKAGNFTGHISYSLAWADRTFKDKNNGKTFPARFDNRHTINILASWHINDKVQLNASWVGHSGNRFTLLSQMWEIPDIDTNSPYYDDAVPLKTPVNNYQLPFYHRLDLSCNVRNSHGYWTFSLYNAYCHLNTIAVRRAHKEVVEFNSGNMIIKDIPVFQKVKLLPIIPSISYTWLF